ncbi:TetR/AcrR family transcriptional regulator [Nocardia altamirensis]|uniref:TetR/AcrR family transcriptional regulator n=1 Tax=Nocardia altamirensis TaxID=472158 RepID=UPI000840480D|nr:TetR/AcrR family transcriptional regulator [Nocardia altamirensis]
MAEREKQKLRTRRALLEAAREIVQAGRPLTIAEVADRAEVGTSTVYRYFSTPQQLIAEMPLPLADDFLADLPEDPAGRLHTIIDRVCDMQFGDQTVWRTAMMMSQQRWLEHFDRAEENIPLRPRARVEMTRTALEPLSDVLPPAALHRLTMAILVVYGTEAMVSAFDVGAIGPAEARDVMQWSARALLDAALAEHSAMSR